MKPILSIVKIGGNIIENDVELAQFLALFSELPGTKILVHGGGKKATAIGERLGIRSTLVQGRRITDAKSLEVAVMVYGGLVNKKIVASLQALSSNAIGLSGADAGSIRSVKRAVREVDFGFVGDVEQVNTQTLITLLQAGLVPVFCALTHDGKGQLLNTNADTIASELAIALSKEFTTTLYYCFEKPGVLKDVQQDDSVITHIDKEIYHRLLKEKSIADGMLPKLENCFHALDNAVEKVCIGNTHMLHPDHHLFTTITL
jgi:acetylglutamate kinase